MSCVEYIKCFVTVTSPLASLAVHSIVGTSTVGAGVVGTGVVGGCESMFTDVY